MSSLPQITPRSCGPLFETMDSSRKKHYKGYGPWIWSDHKAPCYVSLYGTEHDDEGDFAPNQLTWRANWILADCSRSGGHGGTAAINKKNVGKFYVAVSGDEPVGPEPPP